jgi:uncharacterized lipoprotein YbaY
MNKSIAILIATVTALVACETKSAPTPGPAPLVEVMSVVPAASAAPVSSGAAGSGGSGGQGGAAPTAADAGAQ